MPGEGKKLPGVTMASKLAQVQGIPVPTLSFTYGSPTILRRWVQWSGAMLIWWEGASPQERFPVGERV